jgi:hypothetical protein
MTTQSDQPKKNAVTQLKNRGIKSHDADNYNWGTSNDDWDTFESEETNEEKKITQDVMKELRESFKNPSKSSEESQQDNEKPKNIGKISQNPELAAKAKSFSESFQRIHGKDETQAPTTQTGSEGIQTVNQTNPPIQQKSTESDEFPPPPTSEELKKLTEESETESKIPSEELQELTAETKPEIPSKELTIEIPSVQTQTTATQPNISTPPPSSINQPVAQKPAESEMEPEIRLSEKLKRALQEREQKKTQSVQHKPTATTQTQSQTKLRPAPLPLISKQPTRTAPPIPQTHLSQISSRDIQDIIENLKTINKKLPSLDALNKLIREISEARINRQQKVDEITDEQLEKFVRIIFSPEIQNLNSKAYSQNKKRQLYSLKNTGYKFLKELPGEIKTFFQSTTIHEPKKTEDTNPLDRFRLRTLVHITQNARRDDPEVKENLVTDAIKSDRIYDSDFIKAIREAERNNLLPWNNENIRYKTFKLIEKTAKDDKVKFVEALNRSRNYLAITKLWKDPKLRNGFINNLLAQIEKRNEETRIKFLEELSEALSKSNRLLSGNLKSQVFKLLIESKDPIATSNSLATLKNFNLLNKKSIKIFSDSPDRTDHINNAIKLLQEYSKHNKTLFQELKKEQAKRLLNRILNHKDPERLAATVYACYKNGVTLLKEKSIFKQLAQSNSPETSLKQAINDSRLNENQKRSILFKLEDIRKEARSILVKVENPTIDSLKKNVQMKESYEKRSASGKIDLITKQKGEEKRISGASTIFKNPDKPPPYSNPPSYQSTPTASPKNKR